MCPIGEDNAMGNGSQVPTGHGLELPFQKNRCVGLVRLTRCRTFASILMGVCTGNGPSQSWREIETTFVNCPRLRHRTTCGLVVATPACQYVSLRMYVVVLAQAISFPSNAGESAHGFGAWGGVRAKERRQLGNAQGHELHVLP